MEGFPSKGVTGIYLENAMPGASAFQLSHIVELHLVLTGTHKRKIAPHT